MNYFEYFKERVYYWQEQFSLKTYEVWCEMQEDDDTRASIIIDEINKIATVFVSKLLLKNTTKAELDRSALHEILHLLLGKIFNIAKYPLDYTIHSSKAHEHEIIYTLENYILGSQYGVNVKRKGNQ